jgi:DNA (cytosine-5)-methyltransferase 1
VNVAARPINVMSLCAGVGGLELGIHLAVAGARSVCFVEREIAAAASLVASMEAGWFHPCPVWSDLLAFDARPWRGLVHILASGDPCQDNSVAGKRAGSDGERFLAPEVIRIAGECRPDLIFRENVPGNAAEQLSAIVPPLERLGYRVASGIFSSAETGNTMRRERLFIMAERTDAGLSDGGRRRSQAPAGTVCHGNSGDRRSRMDGSERAQWGPHGEPCSPEGQDAGKRGRRQGSTRSGASGEAMARAALQRPGEARTDSGRPEERHSGASGELEQPQGVGPREGWTEHAWEQGRCSSAGTGGAVDDALRRRRNEGDAGDQAILAHSPSRRVLPPAVIPGPTDSRWIDVLDRWPELQPALSQEEAESHLRRGIDAMAHRVERLRATGNGVDPVTAAYAYLRLQERLRECRNSGLVSIAA